jgi:hypothetical protein
MTDLSQSQREAVLALLDNAEAELVKMREACAELSRFAAQEIERLTRLQAREGK